MGKFEKKINKRLSGDVEDFDSWYKKNELKFDAVDNDKKLSSNGNIAVKTKSRLLFIFIGAILMLLLLSVGFIVYNKLNPRFNSDDELRYVAMTENETTELFEQYDFLTKTDVQELTKLYKSESDRLLAVFVKTEFEYGENYYFIDFNIELDESYSDFMTTEYTDFTYTQETEDYSVSYKLVGQDSNNLYNYLMLITTDNEQKIYVQVKCFEDDLSGILEILNN